MYKYAFLILLGIQLSTFNLSEWIPLGQPSTAFGAEQWSGTSAAQFLRITVGARQSAMGEAFCAVSDDVMAICWNPAGLMQLTERHLAFSHAFWLGDTNLDFFGYAQKIKGLGALGGGISWLYYGTLKGTNESGDPTQDFGAYDMLMTVSYAGSFTRDVLFGANLKFIRQAVENAGGNSWAADIGLLFKSEVFKGLNFACVFRNIGPELRFADELRPLPYSTTIGASSKFLGDALTIACDVDIPSNQPAVIHAGAEYWQEGMIAFRGGYRTDFIQEHGALSGLCFGMGFNYLFKETGMVLNIDYAFLPYGDLVGTHKFSTILKF